jgi:hypothetical protein
MAEVFQHATARKEKEVGRGLSPPPHYVRDDYESDKSERDLEARYPLTCGRSCVADGVDVTVKAPDVDDAVGDGRGGYLASGRVVPHFPPGGGVEGVGVVVMAPHVDDAVGDSG